MRQTGSRPRSSDGLEGVEMQLLAHPVSTDALCGLGRDQNKPPPPLQILGRIRQKAVHHGAAAEGKTRDRTQVSGPVLPRHAGEIAPILNECTTTAAFRSLTTPQQASDATYAF